MEGLKLVNIKENQTVKKQMRLGQGRQNPYNDEAFHRKNEISLDVTYIFDSPGINPISRGDLETIIPEVFEVHQKLNNDEGDIRDGEVVMTGWQNLPDKITRMHLEEVNETAAELSRQIDTYVSLGIGGSYLGIEATFCALNHHFFNQLTREQRGGAPEMYFLGQNMDPDYFRDTLDLLEGKRIGLNVISKSGTTTETAIAFRIMEKLIEESWGKKARELIFATTDRSKGALRALADNKGYRSFVIPDNIGGRYSVLTYVGLVGLAMANIDIEEFVAGFKRMKKICLEENFWQNPALVHAAVRYLAWLKGKKIEVVATNSYPISYVARWMEQLFPESEGHKGHGMWVSPAMYSEKLHANGQMVQQGERNILETFLLLREHDNEIEIPRTKENLDGLNFIPDSGKNMNFVNQKVIEGPAYAHYTGGVPNMTIEIPRRNAFNIGQLYYMMERSVALSGLLMGHNPFIQPGVESYKNAMFALIDKPGYEEKSKKMKESMKKLERIRIHAGKADYSGH